MRDLGLDLGDRGTGCGGVAGEDVDMGGVVGG